MVRLWQWLVGLFDRRQTEKDQGQFFDHRRHQLDSAAANAGRAVESGVTSFPIAGGGPLRPPQLADSSRQWPVSILRVAYFGQYQKGCGLFRPRLA